MTLRIENVVIDCADPAHVGGFWSALTGARLEGPDGDGAHWVEAGEAGVELIFVPVPEPKGSKNRVHIDLRPGDQADEVERAVALGARRVNVGQRDVTWVVLADPEGNEFCILRARGQEET